MRVRVYYGLLGAGAVVCAVLALTGWITSVSADIVRFPFAPIGAGLRALSLAGGLANVAAIVIYVALSAAPLAALVVRRRRLLPEDALVGLLSLALFGTLYLFINPGLFGSMFARGFAADVTQTVVGGSVYSIAIAYVVLRVLRSLSHSTSRRLMRALTVVLGLAGGVLVVAIFGAHLAELATSVRATGDTTRPVVLYLVLRYLVTVLPLGLILAIVVSCLELLRQFRADRYSEASVAAARRLSDLCVNAVAVMVLVSLGFNLLQLGFARASVDAYVTVDIPLGPIAFVLLTLLLTRLVTEDKRLKDDHDMII